MRVHLRRLGLFVGVALASAIGCGDPGSSPVEPPARAGEPGAMNSPTPEPVEAATPNDVNGSTIPLQLRVALEPDELVVRIENPTDAPIRVWELGNSWGGASWSVVVRVEGSEGAGFTLRPSNQGYTRNVPRFLTLPAGGVGEVRLAPSGREWTAGEDLSALQTAELEVRVVLDIAPSPEASENGVAVGHVESEAMRSRPPHGWLFQPG